MVGVVVELEVKAPVYCPVAQASRWARTSASSLGNPGVPGFNNRFVLVDSVSDQPRPTTLLGTNPLVFLFCPHLSSPRFPLVLCIPKNIFIETSSPPPARSSSEHRINGPGGGIDCDPTTGCVDYRSLHCSPDYRLALWRIPPFSFPGLASWLFLARLDTVHRRLDEERTSGTGVGGGENCLVASVSTGESRAPPSTPPAHELLSARQSPTRRRTTGINSCGSRHIPVPQAGLGLRELPYFACRLD